MRPYIIGIDTGGTFTDAVVLAPDGAIHLGKAPTTPGQLAQGVLDAVSVVAREMRLTPTELLQQTDTCILGTTQGINTLITRTGSRVGVITTEGFADVLEIGRTSSRIAGLTPAEIKRMTRATKPEPLVPRWLVCGVEERVDFAGEVIIPLHEDDVRAAIHDLVREGVEVVVVSLLWGFVNPVHERRLREMARDLAPELPVLLASEVAPVQGEYVRTMTCVINAYIHRRVKTFFSSLAATLAAQGLERPLWTITSAGGAISWERVEPIYTISSGPAGGMMASIWHARQLGLSEIVTTDVGGTSFDIGVVRRGEFTTDRVRVRPPTLERYQVRAPMIDIISIGAGGGTIAWYDPVRRLLKVGPQSAAANPGPACYGKGGRQPTVTDANLVLGRLNPERFLNGTMRLRPELAADAIRQVAEPLGLDVTAAAAGIIDLVDNAMADLLIKHLYMRGHDPAEFTAFLFGGAGPLHGAAYARLAGIRRAIALHLAPVWSALGACTADVKEVHTLSRPLPLPFDIAVYNQLFADLEARALERLRSQELGEVVFSHSLQMRYRQSEHDVTVDHASPRLSSAEDVGDLEQRFMNTYAEVYGREAVVPGFLIEIGSFTLEARVIRPVPHLRAEEPGPADAGAALLGQRPVFFNGDFVSTSIYDGRLARPGHAVRGPAIVEYSYTTVLIPPGCAAEVDPYRNVVLSWR